MSSSNGNGHVPNGHGGAKSGRRQPTPITAFAGITGDYSIDLDALARTFYERYHAFGNQRQSEVYLRQVVARLFPKEIQEHQFEIWKEALNSWAEKVGQHQASGHSDFPSFGWEFFNTLNLKNIAKKPLTTDLTAIKDPPKGVITEVEFHRLRHIMEVLEFNPPVKAGGSIANILYNIGILGSGYDLTLFSYLSKTGPSSKAASVSYDTLQEAGLSNARIASIITNPLYFYEDLSREIIPQVSFVCFGNNQANPPSRIQRSLQFLYPPTEYLNEGFLNEVDRYRAWKATNDGSKYVPLSQAHPIKSEHLERFVQSKFFLVAQGTAEEKPEYQQWGEDFYQRLLRTHEEMGTPIAFLLNKYTLTTNDNAVQRREDIRRHGSLISGNVEELAGIYQFVPGANANNYMDYLQADMALNLIFRELQHIPNRQFLAAVNETFGLSFTSQAIGSLNADDLWKTLSTAADKVVDYPSTLTELVRTQLRSENYRFPVALITNDIAPAYALTPFERVSHEIESVPNSSSIGAGDATTGAFIYGILEGLSIQRALKLATYHGTQTVKVPDARQTPDQAGPSREEAQRLQKEQIEQGVPLHCGIENGHNGHGTHSDTPSVAYRR